MGRADGRPRRVLAVLVAAAPGLALSLLGLFHPTQLTPATAAAWWQLHVVLLPVFPLLGLALVFLARGERGPLVWVVRVAACVYAAFYGLAVAAQPAGSPVALDLIRLGDQLAVVGVTGFLVASLATAALLVRRDRLAALPGSALLVAAALVFLHSHIYWPTGGLAMLGAGVGCGLLEARPGRPA
jgi:hypothetical protein